MPVGEPAAVSFGEQAAERYVRRGFVVAGLPEQAFLAGDRIGPRVDLDSERATRQSLDVTFMGLGYNSTISRIAYIQSTSRSTTWIVVFDFLLLAGAAYRNRTDDLRITRGMLPASARATCTDSTGNRTDSTQGAGIIRRPVPRPVPRPRPLRLAVLLTVPGKARQPGMTLRHGQPAAG